MYNFDGLWYQLKFSPAMLFFLPGLILFIRCIIIKDKKNIVLVGLGLILLTYVNFTNINSIANPDIKVYEGVFVEDYSRQRPVHAFSTWRYLFDNKSFYANPKYLPVEPEKGVKYRVSYETGNDIIVNIEPVERKTVSSKTQ